MTNNDLHNERELLARLAEGDEPAFKLLIDQYSSTVYRYVFKLLREPLFAEEVVQDVFMQIWQNREVLAQVKNLGAYLFVVSRNYALNALKKMLRQKSRQVQWEQEMASFVEDSLEAQYKKLLDEAISRLSQQQQKVWVLNRQLRLSYAEISREMNISRETVKKYLQTATQSIVNFLRTRGEIILACIIFHFF